MANLRRRIDSALTTLKTAEESAADDISDLARWLFILRAVQSGADAVEQTEAVVAARARIDHWLTILEPVEHETNFAYTNYDARGATLQLSWPGFPAPWDDHATWDGKFEQALDIDRSRASSRQ